MRKDFSSSLIKSSTMAAMSSGFGRVALTSDGADLTNVTSMATGPLLPSITEYYLRHRKPRRRPHLHDRHAACPRRSGGLNGRADRPRRMAVIALDESKTLLRIEPTYTSARHGHLSPAPPPVPLGLGQQETRHAAARRGGQFRCTGMIDDRQCFGHIPPSRPCVHHACPSAGRSGAETHHGRHRSR